jgi:hypothetical protein
MQKICHDPSILYNYHPGQRRIPSHGFDADQRNERNLQNKEIYSLSNGLTPAGTDISIQDIDNGERASPREILNLERIAGTVDINLEQSMTVFQVEKRTPVTGQALLSPSGNMEMRSKKSKALMFDQTADGAVDSTHTGGEAVPTPLSLAMREKIGRIGGIDVLQDLKSVISDLRTRHYSFPEAGKLIIPERLRDEPHSTQMLWFLKEELELIGLDEQIFRLRKRLTLAEFFDTYAAAQADTRMLSAAEGKANFAAKRLAGKGSRKRGLDRQEGRNSHHNRLVLSHFIDLLFPDCTKPAKRKITGLTRKMAGQKIQNWRKAGKPWANMIKRFGKGILALLPQDLTDTE